MFEKLAKSPFVSVLIVTIAVIIVAVGGVVVILGNMTYEQWVNYLWKLALAVAASGVGKGIHKIGENAKPAVQVENVEKVTTG